MTNIVKSTTQVIHDSTERDAAEAAMVAVNVNGLMLLEWFRSLSEHEKSGVMRVVTAAATRVRH
jgi:hypothetical protein